MRNFSGVWILNLIYVSLGERISIFSGDIGDSVIEESINEKKKIENERSRDFMQKFGIKEFYKVREIESDGYLDIMKFEANKLIYAVQNLDYCCELDWDITNR